MNLAILAQKVRGLVYDRLPAPVIFLKSANADWRVTVDSSRFLLEDYADPLSPVTVSEYLFSAYPTLLELLDALFADNELSVAVTPFFYDSYPTEELQQVSAKPVTSPLCVKALKMFSADQINLIATDYFLRYHKTHCSCMDAGYAELAEQVEKLECPEDRKLILFTAYYLLEARRKYEYAARNTDVLFSNDENAFCDLNLSGLLSKPQASLNVSVGDVFSYSAESPSPQEDYRYLASAGVDNVLGDQESIWYRLQLQIRNEYERLFGDFTLRLNQVVMGEIVLEKEDRYYAYYDAYPMSTWFWNRFKEASKSCS